MSVHSSTPAGVERRPDPGSTAMALARDPG